MQLDISAFDGFIQGDVSSAIFHSKGVGWLPTGALHRTSSAPDIVRTYRDTSVF